MFRLARLVRLVRAGILAGAAISAMPAGATETVNATWVGSNPSGATIQRTLLTGPGAPQTNATITVERFDLVVNSSALTTVQIGAIVGSGVANHFYAFCIEPRQFISANTPTTYEFTTLDRGATNIGGMGTDRADRIAELMGRFAPDLGALLTQTQAGALQIAIWEIVREISTNPLSVYAGNISFGTPESPAGMLALAETYLTALDGTGPRARGLYALNNGPMGNASTTAGTQDLLVQFAVPEPATPALLAASALVLIALRRRGGSPPPDGWA